MSNSQETKTTPVPVAIDIQNSVKEAVKATGSGEVRSRIVKQLEEEITMSRVVTASEALTLRKQVEKDLNKINRPDIETFGSLEDGSPDPKPRGQWSKERIKQVNEAKTKLKNIDTAFAEAFSDEPNFEKLEKIVNKG